MSALSKEAPWRADIELLKSKIRVLRQAGRSTADYEARLAELAEVAKLYPIVSELPDLEWIVEGILAKRGITMIGGLTDTGKSTLALQLCGCLLERKSFFGLEVTVEIERIGYACLDQSLAMLKDQATRMLPTFPSLAQLPVIPDMLWDRQRVKGLSEAIERLRLQVVVVDALNAVIGAVDENAAVGPIMRELRRIAESYDVSLIVPHQFRKPPQERMGRSEPTAQDFRGSTEIGAKADVLLALQRNGFEAKLTSVKAKSVHKVQLNLRQDPDTLVYSLCLTRRERIRQLLQEGMGARDVIGRIYEEYRGNWDSIKTMVYRERSNIRPNDSNKP